MANINSQKKRIRQDSKRNIRNKSLKSELKTTLKSLENGEVSSETKNQEIWLCQSRINQRKRSFLCHWPYSQY